MAAQARFWQELVDLKRDCLYVEAYLDRTEALDRGINIFLACTSSTAIAGWVVWQRFGFLWALLIAGAQVVNAIRPWIPYSRRLKALMGLAPELGALAITAEREWFDVAAGSMTEAEIHAGYIELKARRHEVMRSALADVRLPENRVLVAAADAAAAAYFLRRYGQ